MMLWVGFTTCITTLLLCCTLSAHVAPPAGTNKRTNSVCVPKQAGEFAFSGCLPSWPPTYNMSRSTIIMPCLYSGFADARGLLARYGLVDLYVVCWLC